MNRSALSIHPAPTGSHNDGHDVFVVIPKAAFPRCRQMIMTSPLLLDPPTADGSALSGRSTAPRNRSKKLSTVLLVVLLVAAVGTAVWQTQRARELQQRVDAGMAYLAAANSLHDKSKWTNAYPDARHGR